MSNRENLGTPLLQPIDQAIALDKKLPDLWICRFGHTPAAFRKRFKLVDGQNEPLDKSVGILGRVSSDVVLDIFEIDDGGLGPLKAGHFLMKRFFTVSCRMTCPSSAAWMPAAIFLRT